MPICSLRTTFLKLSKLLILNNKNNYTLNFKQLNMTLIDTQKIILTNKNGDIPVDQIEFRSLDDNIAPYIGLPAVPDGSPASV